MAEVRKIKTIKPAKEVLKFKRFDTVGVVMKKHERANVGKVDWLDLMLVKDSKDEFWVYFQEPETGRAVRVFTGIKAATPMDSIFKRVADHVASKPPALREDVVMFFEEDLFSFV